MDKEKAKRDIIYFAEVVSGYELTDYQKDVLKEYEAGEVVLCGLGSRADTLKEIIKKHKVYVRGPISKNMNEEVCSNE